MDSFVFIDFLDYLNLNDDDIMHTRHNEPFHVGMKEFAFSSMCALSAIISTSKLKQEKKSKNSKLAFVGSRTNEKWHEKWQTSDRLEKMQNMKRSNKNQKDKKWLSPLWSVVDMCVELVNLFQSFSIKCRCYASILL